MEDNKKVTGTMADDPMEMASTLLYMYTPKFNAAVDKLSSNALRRVLKRLVSYPLNEKAYAATSQAEQDVFNVGDRLLEAKFIMITQTYTDIIEQEMKKEEQGENQNG
jgi:hypothetical protein